MKPLPVLKKNQRIQLEISGLGSEGQGIGRYLGMAVFVPGALIGETVTAHIIKVTSGYCVGKLVEIITPAANRVVPACANYDKCGGCTLMHLDYQSQLEEKRAQVHRALTHIGKVNNPVVHNTLPMANPWHYRNKGSFPFASVDGQTEIGFFAPRSHRLVPLEDCPIQEKSVMEAALAVRDWARIHSIPPYDENTHTGILRHVMVRVASSGEGMFVLVTNGALMKSDSLTQYICARCPFIKSIIHNRNDDKTNIILGNNYTTLWGASTITTNCLSFSYAADAASFLQVNTAQTEVLYSTAIDYLNPQQNETILDVYCGIGTITLPIAQRAKRVIGIESVSQAIENAKQSAIKNGITNAAFECGTAENILPTLVQSKLAVDAVMLDPPRKGCENAALHAIAQSGAKRIVYVSCNPATLARDVATLAESGYEFVEAQPVDMFPQGGHVECVILMTKKGNIA